MSGPTRRQARTIFGILFLVHLLNLADRFILSAVLPKVRAEFHLSAGQAGLLGSSFLVVYAVATLPLGAWADRALRKRVIAICVGLWSAATTLSGLATNYWQLFTARSVLGVGEAGYGPAAISMLGDCYPPQRRGRVLAVWSTGNLLGAAIGFTVGGLIADTLGWRWAFYIVGIPGFIVSYLVWCLHEPERGASEPDDEAIESVVAKRANEAAPKEARANSLLGFTTVRDLLRVRTYWALLATFVFSFFAVGGTSFWLPTYLVDNFGLSLKKAGLVAGVVLVVSGLIGTLSGGWLADKLQRRRPDGRLIVSGLGLLIGAPLVLATLNTHAIVPFVLLLIPAGVALSLCTGPLWAVVQDIVKPAKRATALGFCGLFAHLLGDAAAPSIIGFLADKSTLHNALVATVPVALFGAGLACMLGARSVAVDMQRPLEPERTGTRGHTSS